MLTLPKILFTKIKNTSYVLQQFQQKCFFNIFNPKKKRKKKSPKTEIVKQYSNATLERI